MPPTKKAKAPGTSPGKSPGKTPAVMTAGGDTNNWEKGKANHVRIGTCFLKHAQNPAWGLIWAGVPEADICSEEFFGSLATFLVEIYVIESGQKNQGKNLASGTAIQVWSGLIDEVKNRFSKSVSEQTKARSPLARPATPARAPRLFS